MALNSAIFCQCDEESNKDDQFDTAPYTPNWWSKQLYVRVASEFVRCDGERRSTLRIRWKFFRITNEPCTEQRMIKRLSATSAVAILNTWTGKMFLCVCVCLFVCGVLVFSFFVVASHMLAVCIHSGRIYLTRLLFCICACRVNGVERDLLVYEKDD